MIERQRTLKELAPKKERGAWKRDASGRWVMPEVQSEFLDWLLSLPEERPEGQKNEAQWARVHGYSSTEPLRNWKKNDRFRAEWTKRAAAKNISVDRLQNILDMLYRRAIVDDDVAAAARWMGWVEKYMPPVRVERDEEAAGLSDEELEAEIRDLLIPGADEA